MTMSDPKEALERLKAENATLRASLKWVPQVQPGHLNGGAYVSMTWGEFNAMREAIGLRHAPYRGSDAKAATNAINMALRVKLETAEADRDALIAKQEGLEREVERLKSALLKANANHEEFERKFYLEQDRAEAAEARLSAMPHIVAGLRFDLRMQCEFGPDFHQAIKDNLDKLAALALLPTVPVERSRDCGDDGEGPCESCNCWKLTRELCS